MWLLKIFNNFAKVKDNTTLRDFKWSQISNKQGNIHLKIPSGCLINGKKLGAF